MVGGIYRTTINGPGLNGEVVIYLAKHLIESVGVTDRYEPVRQILEIEIGEHREPRGRKSIDLITDEWLVPYRILSTGVARYRQHGREWDSWGRMIEMPETGELKPPWTEHLVRQVNLISERWHLNGMIGPCRHQRHLGWTYCRGEHARISETCHGPMGPNMLAMEQKRLGLPENQPKKKFASTIGQDRWECGLNGLSQPCPICGYRMGTAWLFEVLPDDVFRFMTELPGRVE